jgi:hypothetical protein
MRHRPGGCAGGLRAPGRRHTRPATDTRPEPLPGTRTTGVRPRGAQVWALGGRRFCPASSSKHAYAPVAAASLVPSPRSRPATPRWPPRRAPRPVHRDLRGEAEAVQQVRRPAQRVPDMEQQADQRGDPAQRPPLVLIPAPQRRAALQRSPQLRPAAPRSAGIPPRQGLWTPGRLRRRPASAAATHTPSSMRPAAAGDLRRRNPFREPFRGLQPHLLTPGPPGGGQAATIRVPHTSAVAPPASAVTTTPGRSRLGES